MNSHRFHLWPAFRSPLLHILRTTRAPQIACSGCAYKTGRVLDALGMESAYASLQTASPPSQVPRCGGVAGAPRRRRGPRRSAHLAVDLAAAPRRGDRHPAQPLSVATVDGADVAVAAGPIRDLAAAGR